MKKKLANEIGKAYGRIHKRRKHMELKEYGKKWVAKNLGEKYVSEFEHNYDDLNRGIEIGGFAETSMFLDLIDTIRKDKEDGVKV